MSSFDLLQAAARGVSVATSAEQSGQAYIDEMARSRGYVLDYHKVMAEQDFEVLMASNALVEAVYLRQRKLDPKTKELLFILSLTVMRASRGHIASHIKVALELGCTPQEILEAIEIALPEAGVVAFQAGLEVWKDVVRATGLEPTVRVFDGSSAPDVV
jgi:4-carboxymuconolactone decarboxylase